MKKNNLLSLDPIVMMMKSSLEKLPTPFSISFMWNMGFILGMVLTMQIITGIVLSMNYIPSTEMGFWSVIHIMRDTHPGWAMRYIHMNGASLFFISMYIHIARGIYFNSPSKLPMVWISGVLILLVSMGSAFLGYVLPWGQMSFWGATVITSMISAIPYMGKPMTLWIWGNFSVSQPTLNRFFSLHFILPLVVLSLVLGHLIFLHQSGSSNPTGTNPNYDKMKFFPYFMVKDTNPAILIMMLFTVLLSLTPNILGDVENFNPASATTTPTHIQPEWYFLFSYAILRSIPSKLGGVIAMLGSILILLILTTKKESMNKKFNPNKKMMFWVFLSTMGLLTWIGMNPIEPPLVEIGQALTAVYFTVIFYL
nr:cytochrome b [Chortoglyphus arcuatus]UBQ34116.1 cytochrome b [Chortoglyphus arcuatus]